MILTKISQVPAIYAMFFKYLLKNIYFDEMGHDLFNEFVFMAKCSLPKCYAGS